MTLIHAEASAIIPTHPRVVYGIIADYKQGHSRILPEQYFSNLRVEEGGVGEGTVISFTLKVAGNQTTFKMRVEEPEPGRVLVERDLNSDAITTFTVIHLEGGHSLVKIATRWTANRGLRGFVERLASPRLLRKVYEEELRKLEEVAVSNVTGTA